MGAPVRLGGLGGLGKLSGGGILVVLAVVLIARMAGVNLGGGGSGGGGARPEDREVYEFVNFLTDDIQEVFAAQFKRLGKPYRPAKVVVFSGAVESGCGIAGSEIGPFYCPADNQAYIDLSFYQVLRDKLGAGGDFAQAYVLAHEFGHHVQNLLGTMRGKRDNETSIRVELQADCLAGVWAHSTEQRRLLEAGDIEESMNAAAQIGDDRLQKRGGGRVNPETWTHGSSEQRQRWFRRGLQEGDIRACDTFSGNI
jgi:predicted metalloprotease